jgi:hypothetical protein
VYLNGNTSRYEGQLPVSFIAKYPKRLDDICASWPLQVHQRCAEEGRFDERREASRAAPILVLCWPSHSNNERRNRPAELVLGVVNV